MLEKNKIIMVLFFLIFIISLSTVNATGDNGGEILTIDGNDGEVISEAEDVSLSNLAIDEKESNDEGDFQSLKTLIENASENSEVNLTQDYTFTVDLDENITQGIILNKSNITINGNGFSINALNQARIFQIYGDNVKLINLNFIGGSTSNISEDLIDCAGGAILWLGAGGNISSCTFMNNTATKGGAIFVDNDLYVENSVFLDNKVTLNPISLDYNENTLVFTFSGYENYFNAIYSTEDYTVNYKNVTYWKDRIVNSDNEYPSKYEGLCGIKYVLEIYDESGVLMDNISDVTSYGGYATYSYDDFATGNYTYFISHPDDNYFDAVNKTGSFSIVQPGDFQSLQALIDAASENSVINLTNNYRYTIGVDDNITRGIPINKSNITINGNGHYIDALEQTRMFLIYGDNIGFNNITFMRGSTPKDDKTDEGDLYWSGGSILWVGNYGLIENCIFTQNRASGDGGAIKWYGDYGKAINNTFEFNFARSQGGGIYWQGQHGIVLNSTYRYNNLEMNNGAGIFWGGHNGYIANSNFEYNHAETGHGALYFYSHNGTIYNCSFIGNHAGFSGGGVLSYARNATMDHCIFINNEAIELDGGAVNWAGYAGKLTNSIFIGNRGERFAGAVNVDHDNSIIENCTFIDNSARYYGGAVYWYENNGTLKNCTFIGNSANDGGVISWWGENGTISDVIMINNTALNDAGAIQWVGINGNVQDAIIINNSAIKNAGAVQWIGINGTINDVIIENNTAINGGALYWVGKDDYIADLNIISRFEEIPMGVNGSVKNAVIVNNTANNNGGAIYWNGINGNISMSTIKDNTAVFSGSAIFLNNTITLENSIIVDNKCNGELLNVYDDSAKAFILVGYDNYINGIYLNSDNTVNFNNVSYWNGEIVNSDDVVPVKTQKENGINVTLEIYDEDGNLVDNVTNLTYAGLFTYDDSLLESGNYTFIAYHNEDKYYTSSKTEGTFMIDYEIEVNAPDVVKYFGGSQNFVVEVLKNGIGVANKSVIITLNGVDYTRITDKNGNASLGLNLNSGNYTIDVKVDDIVVNSTVTIKPTIIANDLTKMFRNATRFEATFVDSDGNALKNTDVEFNINGVFYTRTTDENGTAGLNINLDPGVYIITSQNPKTGERLGNNITVLSTIVENNDLTKYYKNGSQFVVKILDEQGNAVGAGKVVTFNINGVFYTRTTNESGHVKLNINLNPGDYVITTEYNGLKVSNNIKVLSVLETKDLVMKYKDGSTFDAKLLDSQGKSYPGQSIQFNVNGIFYYRTTDSSGVAKLNINLMPGEYIITSSFNGLYVSNKIKITS